MNHKPIVAITMGDPAGIGPEVLIEALANNDVWERARPLIVGDAAILERVAQATGRPWRGHVVASAQDARYDPACPDVLDLASADLETLVPGVVSPAAARAAVAYIERATEVCKSGQAQAMATGPINKAALKAAGIPFIGHTELLAALLGEERVTTMLATEGLRVVHVTRHIPLAKVAAQITQENVWETIRLTQAGLTQMGIRQPRIAVAALNPHGGDNGLMGREELEEIGPAVVQAQGEGILATGPIPADSVFFRAIRGEFDVVVAMFHDQGHIPIKTHGFERSITVTLGLSVIRTSVDHGTAFDIAWKGMASAESMIEAIRLAAQLATGG